MRSNGRNAEAIAESILLKAVTELDLSREEVADPGRFRQAFQSLRQAIRDDRNLGWLSADDPRYVAFKKLSCKVACLLQTGHEYTVPRWDKATENHRIATSNRWESDWF
jgi:hypothetical protein